MFNLYHICYVHLIIFTWNLLDKNDDYYYDYDYDDDDDDDDDDYDYSIILLLNIKWWAL